MRANRKATKITTIPVTSVISNWFGDSEGVSVGPNVGEGVRVGLDGDGVTEVSGVGVIRGVGVAVGVGVGFGIVGGEGMIIKEGMEGAREFGSVRYGMKFNVPK